MIPKIIHYCWFGGNPLPKLAKECIMSWKKYCPEYEIIRWDESNFDISSAPLYVQQAHEAKKWAFVTDYVRLKVTYDYGGIYLDTDVELLKPLDALLEHQAYFGFEGSQSIATGLGFGAVKGAPILEELMSDYLEVPFIREDGTLDTLACPYRNTAIFLRHGLRLDNSMQTLPGNILILPTVYLCPISFSTGIKNIMPETVSIHWYSASWRTSEQKKADKRKQIKHRLDALADNIIHIPNKILFALIGKNRYEKLKSIVKGK